MEKENDVMVTDEIIISKIYLIRGQKVMLDRDLAELYKVETRALNQAVKRNEKRFPKDFMFQMTKNELIKWKSQIVISNSLNMGLRKPPLVFTEHGVLMLASVLKSERAIQVNIQIVRIFTKIRDTLHSQKDLIARLDQFENQLVGHDEKIALIFEYIKQMEKSNQEEIEDKKREPVGFKQRGPKFRQSDK